MSAAATAVDADVDALERATRKTFADMPLPEAQVIEIVAVVRAAYLAGWARGHDSASAKMAEVFADMRSRGVL